MSLIKIKKYSSFPYDFEEIKRYCHCENESLPLINECINLIDGKLDFRVAYRELNFKTTDNLCDFECVKINSKNLSDNLSGCDKAVVFCATIGIEYDIILQKYLRLSPSKSLILQGIGAERVERLANVFNKEITLLSPFGTKPRFSPGFGDFPLSFQKEIFSLLECEKKIGVTLNSSYLMTPSKSVTAIIGIKKQV